MNWENWLARSCLWKKEEKSRRNTHIAYWRSTWIQIQVHFTRRLRFNHISELSSIHINDIIARKPTEVHRNLRVIELICKTRKDYLGDFLRVRDEFRGVGFSETISHSASPHQFGNVHSLDCCHRGNLLGGAGCDRESFVEGDASCGKKGCTLRVLNSAQVAPLQVRSAFLAAFITSSCWKPFWSWVKYGKIE